MKTNDPTSQAVTSYDKAALEAAREISPYVESPAIHERVAAIITRIAQLPLVAALASLSAQQREAVRKWNEALDENTDLRAKLAAAEQETVDAQQEAARRTQERAEAEGDAIMKGAACSSLRAQLAAAREVIAKKDEALLPFTHPDLSRLHSNTVEKDASPVYGRDKALLTIGDFKRAAAALTLPAGGETVTPASKEDAS